MQRNSRDSLADVELRAAPTDAEPAAITSRRGDIGGRRSNVAAERRQTRARRRSDAHAASEDARNHEAHNRSLLSTAPDAIVSIDEHGLIEVFSAAAQRMFGYREEEIRGAPVKVLMPAEYHAAHEAGLKRYRSGGEPHLVGRGARELVGLRKNGVTFPIELSVGEWWDGETRKFTAIIRDITERKRAEETLRRSEEQFRQIAEQMQDVFYVQNTAPAVISYVSPRCESLWGRPAAELCGHVDVWLASVHPDDRSRVLQARQALLAGQALDEEYRICQPSGRLCWVRDRAFPLRNSAGEVWRIVGVVRDITTERKLEEELRQSQKMEAIGTLASGLAHDFNNLLMGIMGCVNLALKTVEPNNRAYLYLREAIEATQRGTHLAKQLLTFSRRQVANPHMLDLDPVISATAELLQRLVGDDIVLDLDLAASNAVIMADPVQIEQILMNLAANARDAMPRGGTLRLATDIVKVSPAEAKLTGVSQPGHYVRMRVADTGCGMDDHTRARVFEPFFTTKGPGKGTGLGLSTIFAIVRQLRGHITVESSLGHGTEFIMYFPLHWPQPTAVSPSSDDIAPLHRGTVLLVEDERLVRMTISGYLDELGYSVVSADGPDSALRCAQDEGMEIDWLISDVMMPGMSGQELVNRLRQDRPELRVLFISAFAHDDLVSRGVISGGTDVLQKPFDQDALWAALREPRPEG